MKIVSLGEKIKILRKANGFTLKDLAGNRITPGQISLIESGKSNPSMDLLEYIARKLGTDVGYLMESEASQIEKICSLYENFINTYIKRKQWELAEEYVDKIYELAKIHSIEYRLANCKYLKGIICFERDDLEDAQMYFLRANVLFKAINCKEEMCSVFLNLGIISYRMKLNNSALAYFIQAEAMTRDENLADIFLEGKILYYLSKVYLKLDNLEKSRGYCNDAVKKFEVFAKKDDYSNDLLSMAQLSYVQGNVAKALKFSNRALGLYKGNDFNEDIAQIMHGLGELYFHFNEINRSLKFYKKSLELRKITSDKGIVKTYINIANNYVMIKDITKCDEILAEINSYTDFISKEDQMQLYILTARIDMLKGNLESVEKNLLLGLEYAKKNNMEHKEAEIMSLIINYYVLGGKVSQGEIYLKESINAYKEIFI